jgi:hypothetical protein
MVSIAAFQAVDPSSILGHRIYFFPFLIVLGQIHLQCEPLNVISLGQR